MTTSENLTNLSLSQKQALLVKLLQEKEAQPEYAPLSFTQQRLWFLDKLMEGSPNYNISAAVRLKGQIDVKALEKSIAEIVNRHDSLRTTFVLVDETPMQAIAPAQRVRLPVQDLCAVPDPMEEAHRLASVEAQRPFDLAHGPLWRIVLLQIAEADYVLILVMHHIISDGWSVGIFMREMSALYMAFSRNMSPRFTELPIQYADFARWQRQVSNNGNQEIHLNYWKRQLAHAPALSTLPADYARPPIPTYRGKTVQFQLGAELLSSLSRLSQQSGTTLFMTLLAAFAALLSRYSHQDDLVIGSPIANRTKRETEPLIGFFANTLALRIPLAEDPTFKDLLAKVRQITLDAYTHQDTPFSTLVEELQLERDLSYTPLFQVMFALQNQPMQPVKLPHLLLEPIELDIGTAKFDLTLAMTETEDGLTGSLEYSTDLFAEATINRLVNHFKRLLAAVTANPEQRLSYLSLLSAAEEQKILVEWNNTDEEHAREGCLHYFFEHQVQTSPEATAVTFGHEQLSYRHLNERANQLAHYLQELQVGPEVLVAIYMTRSLDMLVAILAVLKAGGAYVPLDPNYPQKRLHYMLTDSQAQVLLTERTLRTRLPNLNVEVISLDSQAKMIEQYPVTPPDSKTTPDHLAYIIYTSGSTGRPKGTMIPHRGLVNYLTWSSKAYRVAEGNGSLVHSSLGFDATITSLLAPLLVGQPVTLLPEEGEIEALAAALIQDEGYGLVKITPAHLAILSQLLLPTPRDHDTVFVIGGEALMGQSLWFWQQARPQARLVNEYGPTETVVGCCVYEVPPGKEVAEGSVPIGRPIANTELYILNNTLKPVPVGVPGELYIGGLGVGRGYLNRPGLTAQKFIPDPFSQRRGARLYRTGDLARYQPDGNIEFLGRIDHQVKIRGYRIELGEIETLLRQHPDIEDVVCLAREDKPDDKRLVAYHLSKPETTPSPEELRTFLRDRLPDYMLPAAFVGLETFPLTPNGKVNREGLPVPDQASVKREKYTPPGTPTERDLAEIWSNLLNIPHIGIHDNFFALGGHSLLTIQLAAQIRKIFQIDVPLQLIFEASSIAQMSTAITAEQLNLQQETVNQIIAEVATLGDEEAAKLYQEEKTKMDRYSLESRFMHTDYLKQLDQLSPEKRELVLKRLRQQTGALGRNGVEPLTESPLIPIRTEGTLPPTFWIHAIDGYVFSYMDLAAELDGKRPFYGLKSIGLEGHSQPLTTIEEMAAAYVQAITTVQSDGPFHLGGWSMGGVIAFEMAQQLQQAGHQVAMLALIDSYVPQALPAPEQLDNTALLGAFVKDIVALAGKDRLESTANFQQLSWKEQVEMVLVKGKESGFLPPNANEEQLHQYLKLFRTNHAALYRYRPALYNGRILLFQAAESTVQAPLLNGWEKLAGAGIIACPIPANHYTILQKPIVSQVAEPINKLLKSQTPVA